MITLIGRLLAGVIRSKFISVQLDHPVDAEDVIVAKLSPSFNSNSVRGRVSININFNTHPPTGKVYLEY